MIPLHMGKSISKFSHIFNDFFNVFLLHQFLINVLCCVYIYLFIYYLILAIFIENFSSHRILFIFFSIDQDSIHIICVNTTIVIFLLNERYCTAHKFDNDLFQFLEIKIYLFIYESSILFDVEPLVRDKHY